MLTRSAGILMPISALPTEGGIGTLGKEAFAFADMLKAAGQTYWQVLPVGPAGKGDSPYQPLSAFAGSELYIDLERLVEDGLLDKIQLPTGESGYVNYSALRPARDKLLRQAFAKFTPNGDYKNFVKENAFWLEPYALFMAIRGHYKGKELCFWAAEDRAYTQSVRERYASLYKDEIDYHKFLQYRFFTDWQRLRDYCHSIGIKLMGDMPIYVSPDGADVWMAPQQFELDEDYNPTHVAGVPPDCFSQTGQRWGNPLYRWDVMGDDDYNWWCQRIRVASKLFDALRIDHFIGLARYWSIPAASETAIKGRWRKGPGKRFIDTITKASRQMQIVAEDLGLPHPSAKRLLKYSGYPGMKVMQFEFDEGAKPYALTENCIIYGATHDNDTLAGWYKALPQKQQKFVTDYIGANSANEVKNRLLRFGYASPCFLAIFQLQDVLWLGSSARMNIPGTPSGNWKWRMKKGTFDEQKITMLSRLSTLYGRNQQNGDKDGN